MSKRIKLIFFTGFIFITLIFTNYLINLYILKSAIDDLQIHTIKNASENIEKWLKEKIDELKKVEALTSKKNHLEEKIEIKNILQQGSSLANFEYIIVGYKDDKTISSKSTKNLKSNNVTLNSWYKQALEKNQMIITKPYIPTLYDSLSISICIPTTDNQKNKGVICGVLPLEYIKKEILDISLPYNGTAFLIDENQKILIHQDKKKIDKNFECNCNNKKEVIIKADCLDNFIFSKGHIKYVNWYLISKLDKKKVYSRVDFQLKINFIIYGIIFLVFLGLSIFYNIYQKKSDENVERLRILLKLFIESDNRGFLLADENHNIMYHNIQFLRLLQIKEKNLTLKNLSQFKFIIKKSLYFISSYIDEISKNLKENQKKYSRIFDYFFNEHKVFLFFTAIPIFDKKGVYNGVVFILSDETQKELENKSKKDQENILFQQAKMAALGEMIGAVSHQWRQPLSSLSFLLGNLLQFKQFGCLNDKIFNDNINYALTNINYLSNTIDTFRDFYLPNKKIHSFDILEAINQTILILEPYFKNSHIDIKIEQDDKSIICHNYKNEFQQIISSLLQNAREAFLEQTDNNKMFIKIKIKQTSQIYKIYIEDNGPGIEDSIQNVLFSPFHTTKGAKGGTGNGLYLAQLIARKKLCGDLIISSYKKPTVFLLSMEKNLKDNKC